MTDDKLLLKQKGYDECYETGDCVVDVDDPFDASRYCACRYS